MSTYYLQAGYVLNITTNESTTGTYARLADKDYSNNDGDVSLTAGSTVVLGPFTGDRRYQVKGINGTPTVTTNVYDSSSLDSRVDALEVYGEKLTDGALPTQGVVVLTKATAGAYTLAAPGASDDGKQVIITSGTAAAHVVTFPDEILYDGTATPKDTATYDAQIGACLHLVAVNEKWHLVSKNVVTLTDEA